MATTAGATARPGVSPPPSMSVYPLAPTAALREALAMLTTRVKVMPWFTEMSCWPSHTLVSEGEAPCAGARGSPGHSGKVDW